MDEERHRKVLWLIVCGLPLIMLSQTAHAQYCPWAREIVSVDLNSGEVVSLETVPEGASDTCGLVPTPDPTFHFEGFELVMPANILVHPTDATSNEGFRLHMLQRPDALVWWLDMGNIGVFGGQLAVIDASSASTTTMMAVDLWTGEVLWSRNDLADSSANRLTDDLVAVTGSSGITVIDVRDGTTFSQIGNLGSQLREVCLDHLGLHLFADERDYYRSTMTVHAIDSTTGEHVFTHMGACSMPVVVGDNLVLASLSGQEVHLIVLEPSTGSHLAEHVAVVREPTAYEGWTDLTVVDGNHVVVDVGYCHDGYLPR